MGEGRKIRWLSCWLSPNICDRCQLLFTSPAAVTDTCADEAANVWRRESSAGQRFHQVWRSSKVTVSGCLNYAVAAVADVLNVGKCMEPKQIGQTEEAGSTQMRDEPQQLLRVLLCVCIRRRQCEYPFFFFFCCS